MRNRNTHTDGRTFDQSTINAVWEKGTADPGYDPRIYRKDSCGAWMQKSAYGNTNSDYGWEIDHVKPVSAGGTDNLNNLQPLYWQNNRHKADNWPNWTCLIGSR